MPTALAGIGVVLDDLIDLVFGQQLAPGALVPGLGAGLALALCLGPLLGPLARSRAALSTRLRRIRRGRSRGVAGVLAQLLFEAADPLLEPSVGDGQPLERL